MKDRIEDLLQHPIYQERLKTLQSLERSRKYCGHDLEHFLLVGRIAESVVKKNGLNISEDLVWGAALLHDMGRVEQYQQGISHDKASVAFAREILFSLEWSQEDIELVCAGIVQHSNRCAAKERLENIAMLATLGEVISFADHFSRKCFMCLASKECKWDEEEKIKKEYYEVLIHENWESDF